MKRIGFLLLAAVLLSACSSSIPNRSEPSLRIITYNIHHGEGIDGRVDIKRIARVILEAKADIVALQEVDRGVARSKTIDIMTTLSDLTGMTYAFGKTMDYQGGDYGNGMLVRFPILEERNFSLPVVGSGEPRAVLLLVLEARGEEFIVINTHLDHRANDEERLRCIAVVRETARRYAPRPVIVCGDFNDVPSSNAIAAMKEVFIDAWEEVGLGTGFTYPAEQPEKRLDYVFLSRPASESAALTWKIRSARVITTDASDHLPVLVEVSLGRESEEQ